MIAEKIKRPVFRYYGGKFRLASWIISHFPAHARYVEPFGGGASVMLAKPPSFEECYNDLSAEVVNVFEVLRDTEMGGELHRLLELTPWAREEFELSAAASENLVEQARRTIIRSFMSFGTDGIARGVSTGFRMCRGDEWLTYADAVPAFTRRLRSVMIERRDALSLFARHDASTTLFYVDPPYPASVRSAPRHGYEHEMSREEDHVELAEILHGLKGAVVLSGYPSDLYRGLFSDWAFVSKTVKNQRRGCATECLWIKPFGRRSPAGSTTTTNTTTTAEAG